MKYIKINADVNLESGLKVPAGAIVVVAEGFADIKAQSEGLIPAQVAVYVFADMESMTTGKKSVIGIADFPTTLQYSKLPVADYESVSAELLLIMAVFADLVLIYGEANIEIISVE
jgi:hypothetical protein